MIINISYLIHQKIKLFINKSINYYIRNILPKINFTIFKISEA